MMASRASLGSTCGLLLAAAGCLASPSGFDRLRLADQSLFHRCQEPIRTSLCQDAQGGDERRQCLNTAANSYGSVFSRKERRKWLTSNGCPGSLIDGSEAEGPAIAARTDPTPHPPAPLETPPDPSPHEENPVPTPVPTPVIVTAAATAVESAPPALKNSGERCHRSVECESDLCVRGQCAALDSLAVEKACPTPAIPTPVTTPAPRFDTDKTPVSVTGFPTVRAPLSERRVAALTKVEGPPPPRLQSGQAREKQLRQTVVAHEPQMKRCVDRQLKLHPALSATGTLVIEIDPRGQITGVAVKGERLAGSPLESCLRDAAVRWQFPASGAAYAVEAPLKVTGSE